MLHEHKVQYAIHSNQAISQNNEVSFHKKARLVAVVATKSHKCSDYSDNLLERFNIFMTGPDRGRNAESIPAVVSDVCRILIAVGAKDDLAIVFL